MRLFACISLLLLSQLAWAQSALLRSGRTYVSLTDVAGLMAYSVTPSPSDLLTGAPASLTVRAPSGVLVVFEGSPDVLWRPWEAAPPGPDTDPSLSGPVFRHEGEWYAPEELYSLLDMRVEGDFLVLPSGRRRTLEFPIALPAATPSDRSAHVDLRNGVGGMALFSPGESSSLLLVDAGLLSLAFPEGRQAVDDFMREIGGSRPLYFVVTALSDTSWDPELVFTQGGRSFRASYPLSLSILAGQAGTVSPEAPVSGVALLPEWLNLREPVTVTWEGAEATFQFRR